MQPIISPKELISLSNLNNIIFIDARSGKDALARFAAGHLAHARHVDLDKDLADAGPDASKGGRHPLPPIEKFAAVLNRTGITTDSHVVVYDDKGGANAAARFWWMLRAVGHEKVQVLSGGLQAAMTAQIPIETETFTPSPSNYPVSNWLMPTADIIEVEDATSDKDRLVIDVREGYRYRGESEPLDLTAGHIPGAVNSAYTENLDGDGNFLSAQELREKYETLLEGRPASEVIVHCGSGVTACHTLLALEEAGLSGAKLYVGSWSEWSRNNKEIATGA
jgi:thiosulfate/3-mercaptopyruvate sulfurtransferase